jgi:hypothetical protein
VDVRYAASLRNDDGFYLYIKLADTIPSGRRVLVSAFIDADGKGSTGYSIQGIGADLRADSQSNIQDGSVFAFHGSDQRAFDWTLSASMTCAFSGSEVEMRLSGADISSDYRVVFATVDDLSDRDSSDYPISSSPAVLTLHQSPLENLFPSGEKDVMEVEIASHGGDGVLQTLEIVGEPSALKVIKPILPIPVGSTPVTVKLRADASQIQSGTFVSVKLNSATGSVPVYISGEMLKGYAIAPPSSIAIDGAFADWSKATMDKQPVNPSVRDGLDVTSSAKSNETSGLALLLGVRDRIFLGTSAPEGVAASGGQGGGTAPPPPKGEDVAILYIDLDGGKSELRAEMHGKYGDIYNASLYKLVSGTWERLASIDAGSNRTTLETMVPSSYLGSFTKVKIYYQIFGWNDLGEGLLMIGDDGGKPLPGPDATPQFEYTPIISDVSPAAFRLSWVSDQAVNGSVEYCQYSASVCDSGSFPGSPSVAYDTMEFIPNGTSLVEIGGLSSGTQYFYRAKARNAGSEVAYSPASSPYPSVTTKTSTSAGFNPPFMVHPYHDINHNYVYDQPPDVEQSYFLVYLYHSGAGALASRGNPTTVVITASNLRDDNAIGDPHQLNVADTITYFVAGLCDDGSGTKYWVNTTASTSVPWTDQPIIKDIMTEKAPELRMDSLMVVWIALIMASVVVLKSRGRR